MQYLLTATVRWEKSDSESRVQVSPELVQVSTASTRWQQPFDAMITDVFEVQGQIAGQVAEALHLALGAEEKQALAQKPTLNLAAYDAFLRAEEAAQSPDVGAIGAVNARRAVRFYEAAVARDTAFALAWARLAMAHANLYLYASPTAAEAAAALYTLARAEALAPSAPETFAARASYEGWVLLDWSRALTAAKRGLALDPAHSDLLVAAGVAERSLGGFGAALEHFTHARELNPRSQEAGRLVGEMLLYLRRWPEARRVFDQALSIVPAPYILQQKAMTYLGAGDLDGARRVLATAPPSTHRVALAIMLALYGDLYWVLDDQAQVAVLAQPLSAFDN